MGLRHEVILTDTLMTRCHHHGQRIVDAYAAGENAASLAVSSHGAERDADLQAVAKMGECAFCQWCGLDIATSLSWTNRADAGWDVQYRGYRIDIKTIAHNKQLLLWPVNKRDFYREKSFDILCLVKARAPRFEIKGWIMKGAFWYARREASKDYCPALTPGTWVVHEAALWPMDTIDLLPERIA